MFYYRIAIGVGDASVRLLDLSKPHKQVIVMNCLWEKIKSRVLHLDWHPVKENLVAFATAEGRVCIYSYSTEYSIYIHKT